MLIDINAYTGHWPFRQLQHNTCKTRLDLMNKYDVDISVISNINGIFYKNTQSANEELHEEVKSNKRFGRRLIPFAVINPVYSGWRDDLETVTKKMGMKGIRIHPQYHRYDLTNPACIELVKRVRDKGLIISLSLRMVDRRVSSWMDINEEWSLKDIVSIIKEVPDAKYLILNAANSLQIHDGENENGIAVPPLSESEINLLKNTDFLMDTSGRALTNLGQMLALYGREKFAFGTHSPILDYRTGLLRIESLRAGEADEKTKDYLRYGNADKFLQLRS